MTGRYPAFLERLLLRRQIQTEESCRRVLHNKVFLSSTEPSPRSVQMSSLAPVMDGVGRAVVGVWRAHTTLEESDGAESSPEAPDRFRKMRPSSSIGSLRRSLRKRLPLRSVQANSLPKGAGGGECTKEPKTSAVRKLTRTAQNSITGVYQRLQRNREFSRDQCLVATPGRIYEEEESASPLPRTPRVKTGRASGSRGRRTPDAGVLGVKHGGGRRQLVRKASLRSPYASPNIHKQRLKFDQDLESVSSGLSRLKRLSRAFDEFIGRDDKCSTTEKSSSLTANTTTTTMTTIVMRRKLDPNGKLSCSNLSHQASRMSKRVGGWVHAVREASLQ
ncbi:LOW QUALITY PROTEIN: protein PIMREG [Festucalex cinctus]